ncbi:uncharacterized protein LOC131605613 [Vicia villosa]|uniref:uncharacterized protein LOC131605613 n=1 Tax=Vicia villosa TaxID=3911 RepID=UPI00273ACF2B|nr:uncharacterized protein LOC131605613 [Vicia villosa]
METNFILFASPLAVVLCIHGCGDCGSRFFTLRYDGASRRNPGPAGTGAVLFDETGNQRFYTLQFDGACRGNPGPAGAGAVLFDENWNVLNRFRKGLGYQTNNAAEYHALILGLEQAIVNGYKHINIQGDSRLVVKQFKGKWRINNPHLRSLCVEALELRNNFCSYRIKHIPREFNTIADAQANLAVNLQEGQVEADCFY